jgi:hypothetical protein
MRNCILAAYSKYENERRNPLSDVWMTRTRSAFYRILLRLLSLHRATLSPGAAFAESRTPQGRSSPLG